MSFRVHSIGTYSLLVDHGRPRSRGLGVPVGGAADRAALSIGNALVGNLPSTLALEITLAGPTLEATDHHACVLVGAPFQLFINDRRHPVGKTFNLRAGDVLTISTTDLGLRAYLCVRGGFLAKASLGSRSAWEPIKNGQELACTSSSMRPRFLAPNSSLPEERGTLRVLKGTHAELFPDRGLIDQEYTITAESNRMGLRLSGKPLARPAEELLSSPVCPGTVQITNDGQPVVLGVDAQTIGGYPRIAQVISADLDKLAQLCPGDQVRFQMVEMPQALELLHARQAWLREWVARLRNSVC